MKNLFTFILILFWGFASTAQSHNDSHTNDHPKDTHTANSQHAQSVAHDVDELKAEAHHDEEAFDAGEMIMHHIGDAYDFHVFGDMHIPLPIIAFNKLTGKFDMFSSAKLRGHGHEVKYHNDYYLDHGALKHKQVEAEKLKAKAVVTDLKAQLKESPKNLALKEKLKVAKKELSKASFLDFSFTKNAATGLMASLLMMAIFIPIANRYKKGGISAPKGIQSFFEPLVIFIRDEVAKPFLGNKADKFLPYLLTIFFFIWILNMIGLVPFFPGGANVTGNIGVTMVLALFTFFITNLNGNKHYWSHIFKPDVPVFLYPIIVPVEILGMFTKPFALMVRLMANITAGHIIILSLVSLVFIFGNAGQSVTGGLTGGVVATAFGLFMNFMELLVAVIQAFIFTTLSAVFIGMAVEDHHDH